MGAGVCNVYYLSSTNSLANLRIVRSVNYAETSDVEWVVYDYNFSCLVGYNQGSDSLVIYRGLSDNKEVHNIGLYSICSICVAVFNTLHILFINASMHICVYNISSGEMLVTGVEVSTGPIYMIYSSNFSTIYILYPNGIEVYRICKVDNIYNIHNTLHIDTGDTFSNSTMSLCIHETSIILLRTNGIFSNINLKMQYDKSNALDFFSGVLSGENLNSEYKLWHSYRTRLLRGGFGYKPYRPEFVRFG